MVGCRWMKMRLDWNKERYRTRDRLLEYGLNGCPIPYNPKDQEEPPIIEFITSTNTIASNALTGVTTSNLIADGMTIIYKTVYPLSEENTTLELFNLSDDSLGSYPIYLNDATQCRMPFEAGTALLLSYHSNKWYLINPFAAVL